MIIYITASLYVKNGSNIKALIEYEGISHNINNVDVINDNKNI